MPRANPGEVWIVNLGLAAKVRPGLVLSDFSADDELSLLIVVPHTTAVRDNRWELSIPKPFLKPGVFHLQQLQSVPIVRLERKIGADRRGVAARTFEARRPLRLAPPA